MALSSDVRNLIAFAPQRIVQAIAANEMAMRRVQATRGAILFVDIEGFTPLTVAYSALGSAGAEGLHALLGRYYTVLIDCLEEWGGVVYQFAGDSILAELAMQPGEDDALCTNRAAAAALDIQARLRSLPASTVAGQEFAMRAKAGLGYGAYQRLLLGDASSWLCPLLSGDAVRFATDAEKGCAGGEVVAHHSLAALLNVLPGDERIARDALRLRAARLPAAPRPGRSAPPSAANAGRMQRALQRFVPQAVLERILSAHIGFRAEYREAVCLQVHFSRIDYDSGRKEEFSKLNELFLHCLRAAEIHGGALLGLDLSDKGGILLTAFGAPQALERKEERASRMALQLAQSDIGQHFELRCAAASGQLFCGEFGSLTRKTYTLLGEPINLATRLATDLQVAGAAISESVKLRLNNTFNLLTIEGRQLKGIAGAVQYYRLLQESHRPIAASAERSIIGREQEMAALRDAMNSAAQGRGCTATLEGEAGVGKSRLLAAAADELARLGFTIQGAVCLPYERYTPYFVWRDLLRRTLQLPAEAREAVAELSRQLSLCKAGADWAPALARMLGYACEEPTFAGELSAQERSLQLAQIVLERLQQLSAKQPLALILEDAHWIDEASMGLLHFLLPRLGQSPILSLLTLRPDDSMREALRSTVGPGWIELRPLDGEMARQLLRQRMRLASPDARLEDLVLQAAGGNPFFIETLVDHLIDQGDLVESGVGRRLATDLRTLKIPHSLRDAVLARIDALNEDTRVTLKTASVIGRSFPYDTLVRLLPDSLNEQRRLQSLQVLEATDLAHLHSSSPRAYIFKHIVIRDVAYETTLLSTRQFLHQQLANWLEQQAGEASLEYAETLAYHFDQAGVADKALQFSLEAASHAISSYANREALHHFQRSLELLEKGATAPSPDVFIVAQRGKAIVLQRLGRIEESIMLYRQQLAAASDRAERATLHFLIGAALHEIERRKDAIREMESGLALLGRRPPRTRAGVLAALLAGFAQRLLRRLLPWFKRPVEGARSRLYRQRIQALETISKLYFLYDLERYAWSTLQHYNLAERVGDAAELSVATAAYGLLLNGLGQSSAALHRIERSLRLAEQSNDLHALALTHSLAGARCLFDSDPEPGLQHFRRSIELYQRAGGVWEHLTAIGSLGQIQFLLARFAEAAESYNRAGDLADAANSPVHRAWRHCKTPYCEYLLGRRNGASAFQELEIAAALNRNTGDMMNHLITLGHMAGVAVREKWAEDCAQLARQILETNELYRVELPWVKVALCDAVDAAVFAMLALPAQADQMLRLARRASKLSMKLAKKYAYLRGPALRSRAALLQALGKPQAAEQIYRQALASLESSAFPYELALTLAEAGDFFEDAALQTRAQDLLAQLGLRGENERWERRRHAPAA
ncbi:MAG: AAA family ATPase [Leptospirales bacterium]|nr:AAA family ATPase [Leptospirales bacterium]